MSTGRVWQLQERAGTIWGVPANKAPLNSQNPKSQTKARPSRPQSAPVSRSKARPQSAPISRPGSAVRSPGAKAVVSKTHKHKSNRERIRAAREGKESYPCTRQPKAATTKARRARQKRSQAWGGVTNGMNDFSNMEVFGGGQSVAEMSEIYFQQREEQNLSLEDLVRSRGELSPFINRAQQEKLKKKKEAKKRRDQQKKQAAKQADQELKAYKKKHPHIYGVEKDKKYFGFGSEAFRSSYYNATPTDIGFGAVYPTRPPETQQVQTKLAGHFGVGPAANDYYLYLQSIGMQLDS